MEQTYNAIVFGLLVIAVLFMGIQVVTRGRYLITKDAIRRRHLKLTYNISAYLQVMVIIADIVFLWTTNYNDGAILLIVGVVIDLIFTYMFEPRLKNE